MTKSATSDISRLASHFWHRLAPRIHFNALLRAGAVRRLNRGALALENAYPDLVRLRLWSRSPVRISTSAFTSTSTSAFTSTFPLSVVGEKLKHPLCLFLAYLAVQRQIHGLAGCPLSDVLRKNSSPGIRSSEFCFLVSDF